MLVDPRNHVVNNQPNRRRIYFTPRVTGRAVIQIEALGITDGDDPLALPVTSCNGSGAVARAGRVELPVTADKRVSFDVTFDESYSGPITLKAASTAESPS